MPDHLPWSQNCQNKVSPSSGANLRWIQGGGKRLELGPGQTGIPLH